MRSARRRSSPSGGGDDVPGLVHRRQNEVGVWPDNRGARLTCAAALQTLLAVSRCGIGRTAQDTGYLGSSLRQGRARIRLDMVRLVAAP